MRPGSLSLHMETHAGQPCECDVCGEIQRNSRALAVHKRRAHFKHRSEYCGKTFSFPSGLREHVAIHDEKREEYRCTWCPRKFTTLLGRKNHVRIGHSDARFTCDSECGLHSASRSEYIQHLNSRHAKQHPATCKCVPINVMVAKQVAKHLRNAAFVEAGGTMKCIDGGCDFETTCARRMESHKDQRHHDAYQPVLHCGSCQTWCSSPGNLKRHNADKHQGERRFKCDDCG
ncbi:hypothetical protein AAVH_40018, partial [Aphelenchoides avenae]